jgi:ferredoxin
MPQITIEGVGAFEVPAGKRMVLALTDDCKIDQLHACGGQARCTTCRVQFIKGEPDKVTKAERDILAVRGLGAMPGLRLSCQINCDHDMHIKVVSRLQGSGRADAGTRPAEKIEPPPVWS